MTSIRIRAVPEQCSGSVFREVPVIFAVSVPVSVPVPGVAVPVPFRFRKMKFPGFLIRKITEFLEVKIQFLQMNVIKNHIFYFFYSLMLKTAKVRVYNTKNFSQKYSVFVNF